MTFQQRAVINSIMQSDVNIKAGLFKSAFKKYVDVLNAITEIDLLISPIGFQTQVNEGAISIIDTNLNKHYIITEKKSGYTLEMRSGAN
jgi:hypothetical protein